MLKKSKLSTVPSHVCETSEKISPRKEEVEEAQDTTKKPNKQQTQKRKQ